jgi:iron complex transport system substrate-binding protein
MLSRLRILTCIIALSITAGCNQHAAKSGHIFDLEAYTPQHASGFVVECDKEHNTIIRVTQPWQGKAPAEQSLAIFHNPEDAHNYNGQHMIGYAERVVCMSSSHIAMLDAVGKADAIVGVSGKQYIFNPAISTNPNIKDIGYDSNIDYEALVSLHPDVVLMYGITSEDSTVTAKLRELNIPYLYLGDYTEQSPLGKAEWVVVLGEIVGCRATAIELFRGIEERYTSAKYNIIAQSRPKVMFNLPYQDVWYMPADDSYMVRLVEDAGGEYIYKGKNTTGGSKAISLEEALRLMEGADIWLNPSGVTTLDELRTLAPHFVDCKVITGGNVYNNNKIRTPGGGSDFWESAIVCPDIVLSDMASIMSGKEENLHYHHKLK